MSMTDPTMGGRQILLADIDMRFGIVSNNGPGQLHEASNCYAR